MSTSAIDIVETIFFPLGAAVVAVGILLFVNDDETKCKWFHDPDSKR